MAEKPLEPLVNPPLHQKQPKSYRRFITLQKLLDALSERALPDAIVAKVNEQINKANTEKEDYKVWKKQISKSMTSILQLLEKNLKIVPKNHYRNQWMALGMTVFGLPLGTAFGLLMDNIGLLGIGLPIGIIIGLGIGSNLDNKADKEGRQLAVEIG